MRCAPTASTGEVKVLTSCPSCLQGLSRFDDDAGTEADYIVVEIAKHVLGELDGRLRRQRQPRRHRARAGIAGYLGATAREVAGHDDAGAHGARRCKVRCPSIAALANAGVAGDMTSGPE